jgi:hypothetical protein
VDEAGGEFLKEEHAQQQRAAYTEEFPLQHRAQEGCTVPNTTNELWISGFHIDKAE